MNNKVYNVIENNTRLSHVNMLNHRIKSTFHGIYFCRFPNADFSDKVGIIRHRKILRYLRSLYEKSDFMFLISIWNNNSRLKSKIPKANPNILILSQLLINLSNTQFPRFIPKDLSTFPNFFLGCFCICHNPIN